MVAFSGCQDAGNRARVLAQLCPKWQFIGLSGCQGALDSCQGACPGLPKVAVVQSISCLFLPKSVQLERVCRTRGARHFITPLEKAMDKFEVWFFYPPLAVGPFAMAGRSQCFP